MSNVKNKREADQVKGYAGSNPFNDYQPRNYSDSKVVQEFCPTSTFWSLFNDQHEVLLGTRGSGKTFLLKMMRYSMLKGLDAPEARRLVSNKNYFAMYVPMHLERVSRITSEDIPENKRDKLFRYFFNCTLAEALLVELIELINETEDENARFKMNHILANRIYSAWYGKNHNNIANLSDLTFAVDSMFYNTNLSNYEENDTPPAFTSTLCSALLSVRKIITSFFEWNEEPTWIICVDEAEFLKEYHIKQINSIFRSDSNRIALKIATLPYYHTTKNTSMEGIFVAPEDDYRYTVIDMTPDDPNFIKLTNSICKERLKQVNSLEIETLEDFVGCIGHDNQIDYYRQQFGAKEASQEIVHEKIISEFSESWGKSAANQSNQQKAVYNKYAPIYYLREMYKQTKKGNSEVGWYAGAKMIRKIAQGNPRMYIHVMHNLFERARTKKLLPKEQNRILFAYSKSICDTTKALEIYGPKAKRRLEQIASRLHEDTHSRYLISVGNGFKLSFTDKLESEIGWIQQAVAYSRLLVDEESLKNGINPQTIYHLANVYAAVYWIPMRNDRFKVIEIDNSNDEAATAYSVIKPKKLKDMDNQISIFAEEDDYVSIQ